MATLDQAIQQMLADGMPDFKEGRPRVNTPRVVRYGPKGRAWYRLFEYAARNGRYYITGAYGIWGQLEPTKIRSDFEGMDSEERERLRRSQTELEARERNKRAQRASFASNRALQQWNAARASLPEGVECAYLKRKGVAPEKGLRFFKDGTLLVPMLRYDVTEDQEKDPEYKGPRRLVGLQKIAPDGEKRFNRGMAKDGAMCRLGKAKDGDTLLIAEGVATALSIRESTEHELAVFVGFDAYNLLPAAKILRALYPKSPLLFCADDDWKTVCKPHRDEGKTEPVAWASDRPGWCQCNPGVSRAMAAAAAVSVDGVLAQVVHPSFVTNVVRLDGKAVEFGRGDKDTDFNDLAVGAGLGAVAAQLEAALKSLGEKAREAGAAPKEKGGGGKKKAEVDWGRYWDLVDRFTLIYPSDTAYDHVIGDIVAISHMRYMFGDLYVSMWLGSKRRRHVNLSDVVFEPAGAKPDQLNLFRGFAVKPSDKGSCAKLLELIHYLCGENHEDTNPPPVTAWVLRWLAYPLQHPGAKMQTALAMHGREGTGKNLFFGAVRSIYGVHGGIITQRQLEDKFNLWLSAKLFLIANEVVTRAEMRHNVGFIKSLITEDEIFINRKNKDERFESNHCNLAFLSNELQMMQVGIDDRRLMVIKTPAPKERSFYQEVAAEVKGGGVEALYHHLLHLDLADFNEHTKPIETSAKKDLIDLGLASPQLFWRDIKEGELGVPYVPCRVEDLYRLYLPWCKRNGVKMPAQVNRFIPDFMSMNGVRRKVLRVPDIDRLGDQVTVGLDKQRKVLLMGEQPKDKTEQEWVRESVLTFYGAAMKYWGA